MFWKEITDEELNGSATELVSSEEKNLWGISKHLITIPVLKIFQKHVAQKEGLCKRTMTKWVKSEITFNQSMCGKVLQGLRQISC